MSNSETESILKKDGDSHITKDDIKNELETKEKEGKEPKSVSFNQDVHVKRFGVPRETRISSEKSPIRKEPFTYLSTEELIEEANKVRAQAESVTCTADHPPEKFNSLPHRKKPRDHEKLDRRNSDETDTKKKLGRSASDVSNRNKRTSLSTLFRRAQKKRPSDIPVKVTVKPVVVVKRSKSDVSDLKSNNKVNLRPIRKRSGSETEEFLKSLRNKKTQLSPIIENSPRIDYFTKTSPLDVHQKCLEISANEVANNTKPETNIKVDVKVNPIEKPPRYKSPDKEPKPPVRTKRGKSLEKELDSQPTTKTPRIIDEIKKKLIVDEVDCSVKTRDLNPIQITEKIRESIDKIKENFNNPREMVHSSQKPPEKPPLTRGQTVSPIVRILREDTQSPPPSSHFLSSHTNGNSQPFSYTRPSVSPDPTILRSTTSPFRSSTPIKMDKGVVYAQVVRDQGENGTSPYKQTVHKTYSPTADKFNAFADDDEGLGNDARYKTFPANKYNFSSNTNKAKKIGFDILDSPIRPRYREYKLTNFEDYEPTYSNGFAAKGKQSPSFLDSELRGRADGMDTKRNHFLEDLDNKWDKDFNILSHRRKLLESRLNARKHDRPNKEIINTYHAEDPIYEANKKLRATEKYVNETAKYYRQSMEKDGFSESIKTEDYNRYDSDNNKTRNHSESRTFERIPTDDKRDYTSPTKYDNETKYFPPEPEYEPPKLDHSSRKISTENIDKKYGTKTKQTSHDLQKTKKNSWFNIRKGHHASNPEIAGRAESPFRYNKKDSESYHNSLQRDKKPKGNTKLIRHSSSRDYTPRKGSPTKYEDSRLIDSGIEHDFRKGSNNGIHKSKYESDDEVRDTSRFLDRERQHAENTYPDEGIYTNGDYLTKFGSRERSADDGAQYDPRDERFNKSPSNDDKISAKPPKATKKLSGLEKVKQLFSRDSLKKSKKEKEVQKPRTRVLKSPEHLDEPGYKRYTDPEPSDEERRRGSKDGGRNDISGYRRGDPRDSDNERNYKENGNKEHNYKVEKHLDNDYNVEKHLDNNYKINRYSETDYKVDSYTDTYKPDYQLDSYKSDNMKLDRYNDRPYKVEDYKVDYKNDDYEEDKFEEDSYEDERGCKVNKYTKDKYKRIYREENRVERRRYGSSEQDGRKSPRVSDGEDRMKKSRSKTIEPLDSPALAERYRERRRLATPSPSPSPPRRAVTPPPPVNAATNWFKSLDRLTNRKKKNKVQKESIEEDARITPKSYKKTKTDSPAKNLRFFGDSDLDSDNSKRSENEKGIRSNLSKSQTSLNNTNTMGTRTRSHTSLRKTPSNTSSVDETDFRARKSTDRGYKLRNITEKHSDTENHGKIDAKPPRNPYDRSSRSQSRTKTLRADGKVGSRSELRDDRGSSSDVRGSKLELNREIKHNRRRTPGNNSGESSTEGESSHPSQRSVVFLHATTVGDIPNPEALSRNRSRDDVSSVNSSNLQVKTTQKSFSLFAPWTPRHYNDPYDVNYAQTSKTLQNKRNYEPGSLQKKKSSSQTSLQRRPHTHNRLSNSTTTLNRRTRGDYRNKDNDSVISSNLRSKSRKSQSNEGLNQNGVDRGSRSNLMPKDKKAGWFNLNKSKKQEINTRVR